MNPSIKISFFRHAKDSNPVTNFTLDEVFDMVKNGYEHVPSLQEKIRTEPNKKTRSIYKQQLPAVTFGGMFSKRNKESLVGHSGYIVIDIDDVPNLEYLKDAFSKDKYVVACFISPSGNGLKVVFNIDICIEKHETFFLAIKNYIKNKYDVDVDDSGKDVCRLCFLAYDKEIFINENYFLLEKQFLKDNFQFKIIATETPAHTKPIPPPHKATLKIDNKIEVNLLDKCFEIASKKSSPTDGSLNQFVGIFSHQANRYNISSTDVINFLSQYARPDHDLEEITSEVNYVYKNNTTESGKYQNEANKKTPKAPAKKLPTKQHETVSKFNTDVVFWYVQEETNKTTGEVKDVYKFSYNRAVEFLQNNGFYKYFLKEGEYHLIQVDQDKHIVEIVSELRIKEFMFDFLKSENTEEFYQVREMFRRGIKMYANKNVFDGLDYFYPVFKRDTQTSSFAYFKNCFLEITAKEIIKRDYSQQEAYIWKKQIVDIEYTHIKNNTCDFNNFLVLAMTGRKDTLEGYDEIELKKYESVCSTVGYLLHSYKNPALTKAVLAVDRNKRMSSSESNGGTGKSLFSKAIGKMLNMTIIDGANFKFDYEFAFQQCNVDTALVNFNDVNKNFDFTRLFGMITEEFSFSKKGKDAITLPFSDSPKIYISTNQSMRGDGNSHHRRQQIIEFSDYFIKVDPIEEFKHRLFDDWDANEWTSFYSFMVDCIQLFLEKGLISFPIENYEHNKLVDMAGEEFVDYMEEIFYDDAGNFVNKGRNDSTEMFKKYVERTKKDKMQPNTFTKYVKSWAKVKGLVLNAHRPLLPNGEHDRDKSGSICYYTFTHNNEEISTPSEQKTLPF